MPTNLPNTLVESIMDRPDAARLPAPVPDVGPGLVAQPHDPPPLDWGQAVDAAAARLDESWVRPDATGHMLASGLADELAATLCAYGMVAAEVDHMHDRADDLAASRDATRA